MNRKEKPTKSKSKAPCSSHSEAEVGVKFFDLAALRRNRPIVEDEPRKPIVSIDGRDVEEIPGTKDRVA